MTTPILPHLYHVTHTRGAYVRVCVVDVPSSASGMSETEAASLVEADATRKHLILTELFGVHPRAIVDALVVSANEHLYILGSQLEDHVRSLLHDREEADKEAEEGVHSILTLLEHAIDHTMDTFELYCLRSIFVVTPEQSRLMTMSHHRGLDLRPLEVRHAENPMQESEAPVETIPDAEDRLWRQIACVRTF